MEFLKPEMPLTQVNQISALGLAHIGDGVYELMMRSCLCTRGLKSVGQLHRSTVSQVNAGYQAAALNRILPDLTPEEQNVVRRGRNAKVNSVPHNATLREYHDATALEALFGWLFLQGRSERLENLFSRILEEDHAL